MVEYQKRGEGRREKGRELGRGKRSGGDRKGAREREGTPRVVIFKENCFLFR